MNLSMLGLPVHHKLQEFTQTHAHRVGDVFQLSYPLSSPSPPAPNPSQHQGLFKWVNSLHDLSPLGWTVTTNWFQIGKGVQKSCLFNLDAEYIMQNARVDEPQDRIKIARRNFNNLRYKDDTTMMEQKSLLRRVEEESEKPGLKFNIQKTKIMACGTITSWKIEGGELETVTGFLFLGSKITGYSDWSMKLKDACTLERNLWQT